MHVGLIGGLGLSLADFMRIKAHGAQKFYPSKEGKAKSVIHIYLPGGMAHQESWDPKPYSPLEYRGPFKSIPTKIPGVHFSENFKESAKIADKITVCRSMTHGEAAHERGTHNMFTGYRPSPATSFPSMGSVVSHEFGSRKNLPPYVCIPKVPNEFAGSGYLSSSFGPFGLGSDPADENFKVRDLTLPDQICDSRFSKRKSLLSTVDSHFRKIEKSDALGAMDKFYNDAYSLISSEEARVAFDLSKENDKTKDRYGRNEAGQRMLLSRRLVESGVRFVSMTYGGWDMHQNIEAGFDKYGPNLDQAFATLISDLDDRGLLDSTLVMLSSEFGRTPKINKDNGRDHYPKVFSVVLAGGGITRGQVYGSSDAFATAPEDNPLSVEDLATTVYDRLGIVADKELMAPGDRPMEIVDGGKVIQDICV
ncbi:MAG: sulfatase [Opitutae bacterium]|nr:sulfatase [Opitutae bacterium]